MIFLGQLILFRPKFFWGTNVCKDVLDFLFFSHKDVSDFLKFYLKLILFIYFFLLPPSFSKSWGPLSLEGLRQWPNWPSGRAGPKVQLTRILKWGSRFFRTSY